MKTIKKLKEEITYKFNEKEKKKIIKRVLEENKYSLSFYWDYNDELSEEQISKIILEEEGLNEVEDEIYLNNLDYIDETIYKIIEDNLNEKEETDEDLKEELREVLRDNYDFNIKDLIKNSNARFRMELNTNEDFLFIPDYKNRDYYKDIKKVFKGYLKVEDLKKEINSFIGSDYGKLTFFFNVSGEGILRLRENYLKGYIEISKDINGGFFNSYSGCGGMLELKTIKNIKLNIKKWNKKGNSEYNYLNLCLDSVSYGIQETYGLTGECWRDY